MARHTRVRRREARHRRTLRASVTISTIDSQPADVQVVGERNWLTVRAILTSRSRRPRIRPHPKWNRDTAVREGDEDRADDHVGASRK